jgi:hypothetical protein
MALECGVAQGFLSKGMMRAVGLVTVARRPVLSSVIDMGSDEAGQKLGLPEGL